LSLIGDRVELEGGCVFYLGQCKSTLERDNQTNQGLSINEHPKDLATLFRRDLLAYSTS
jgi:hypothetical protein